MNFYESVYAMVKKVPKGNVTTYGAIAALVGNPRAARAVGYALNALQKQSETEVPWQRVINAKGTISFKGDVFRASLQKELLEGEGVWFDEQGKIDLKKYGWCVG